MRRNIFLPVLALAVGAAGAALRLVQRLSGYDPSTLTFHGPAVVILPALLAVYAAFLAVAVQGGKTRKNPNVAYRCPNSLYMTLKAMSAFLFLGAGALALYTGVQTYRELRFMGMGALPSPAIFRLLCGIFCVLACPCILKLAQGFYREIKMPAGGLMSLPAPVAGLCWVFVVHLDHSTDPVLNEYGYTLLAAVTLMLSQYYLCCCFYGQARPRRGIFFCLLGVSAGITALADFTVDGLLHPALILAFGLSALADSYPLLRSTFGPPWPRRLVARMPSGASEESSEDPESREIPGSPAPDSAE